MKLEKLLTYGGLAYGAYYAYQHGWLSDLLKSADSGTLRDPLPPPGVGSEPPVGGNTASPPVTPQFQNWGSPTLTWYEGIFVITVTVNYKGPRKQYRLETALTSHVLVNNAPNVNPVMTGNRIFGIGPNADFAPFTFWVKVPDAIQIDNWYIWWALKDTETGEAVGQGRYPTLVELPPRR